MKAATVTFLKEAWEAASKQSPRGQRRKEEPGKRQEGPGAEGAQQDPGHSRDPWPTVEPTEGVAMEERWPPTPGG